MKYRESQLDKDLRTWFANDMSKALLRSIKLCKGAIRGINSLDIKLDYPIVAFAGVNGAGKSTILAMACCAFHNKQKGFKLPRRKLTYYTFSDFFIQHLKEIAPQGIEIEYGIAHNKWQSNSEFPAGVGLGTQVRRKQKGGKWNDYRSRVSRNVVFLGIERIVPHSERSQSKSYSRSFKDVPKKGWEDNVMNIVGSILGKKYDEFRYMEHSKYSLPLVKCGGVVYSGFNMGAGENALFEIFSNIYSAGDGALLVMDEVELGLHSRAQRIFMKKLKEVCLKSGTQIICTTHSKDIFESLPDDARFFVESISGKTRISNGVSPEFAFSRMGATHGSDALVLVEDDVARALIQECLPADVRSRIDLKAIGSASALSRQLAAAYVRKETKPTFAVFDGDQRKSEGANISHAKKMAENSSSDFVNWFKNRISYLPGSSWPEAWLIEKSKEEVELVSAALSCEVGDVLGLLEYALQAGKHNEFAELAQHVGLSKGQVLQKICEVVVASFSEEFDELRSVIKGCLP